MIETFTDINTNFFTNDGIVTSTSIEAIENSIHNIIFTSKGEKVGDPNFGTGISKLLFNQMSPISETLIESEIRDALSYYEKRIVVDDISVVSNFDTNSYSIRITYHLVSLPDTKELYVSILKRL